MAVSTLSIPTRSLSLCVGNVPAAVSAPALAAILIVSDGIKNWVLEIARKSTRTCALWFGANTAIWDNDFGDTMSEKATTVGLLNEMGTTTLRFPGGSLSDEYHWATGKSLDNTFNNLTLVGYLCRELGEHSLNFF